MGKNVQLTWKMITLLTVLALGLVTLGLAQSNRDELVDQAGRTIAGIPRSFSEVEEDGHPSPVTREIVHSFGCGKGRDFSTPLQEEFIRFKGSLCGKKWKETAAVIIGNKTNGFTASVFSLGDKDFLTDHIKLNEGRNEILVRYESEAGVFEETVVIMHQMPQVDSKQKQAFYF